MVVWLSSSSSQAQLRAAVFHVLHEHEPDEELTGAAHRLEGFGPDGQVALELVLDFLAVLQLEHSLAVLTAEASVDDERRSRLDANNWLEALGLRAKGGSPLLIQLLQLKQQPRNQKADDEPYESDRFGSRDDRPWAVAQQEESRALEQLHVAKISTDRPSGISTSRVDVKDDIEASRLERERGNESEENMSGGPVVRDEEELESVASASELDESIAEEQSTSLSYSQEEHVSTSRDDASARGARTASRSSDETSHGTLQPHTTAIRASFQDESDNDGDTDQLATRAKDAATSSFVTPPPVPTALPVGPTVIAANATNTQQDDDEFDEVRPRLRWSFPLSYTGGRLVPTRTQTHAKATDDTRSYVRRSSRPRD